MPALVALTPTALHPGLALVAVAVGGLALALGRRRPGLAGPSAAVGAATWLAVSGQVPPTAAVAVLVAAIASVAPPRGRPVAGLAAIALLLVARPHASAGAIALLALGGLAVLAASREPGDAAGWWTAGLLAASAAATFVGAPDTEGAVVAAGALLPALAGSRPRARVGRPWAPLLLALWVCVDGYRGRPAGLTAAAVAASAVVVAALAAGRAVEERPIVEPAASLAAILAIAVVAARTIGLHRTVEPADVVLAAALAGIVLAAGAITARRAPARRPGG